MSVNLHWAGNEHTLLWYEVLGDWTWGELYAAVL
jgi:hypothetical protein